MKTDGSAPFSFRNWPTSGQWTEGSELVKALAALCKLSQQSGLHFVHGRKGRAARLLPSCILRSLIFFTKGSVSYLSLLAKAYCRQGHASRPDFGVFSRGYDLGGGGRPLRRLGSPWIAFFGCVCVCMWAIGLIWLIVCKCSSCVMPMLSVACCCDCRCRSSSSSFSSSASSP